MIRAIIASCVLITAGVLSTFYLSVRSAEIQTKNALEIRGLIAEQRSNSARIRALEDEQFWLRSKVKIHREDLR